MHPLLRHLQTIYPLPAAAAEALEAMCRPLTIDQGQDLQSIGHTCTTIYFVETGILRVYYLRDGNDITESFELENSIVARAESLFMNLPSSKGIQAVTHCRLWAIPSHPLFAAYDAFPALERLFRKVFERAHVKAIHRMEQFQLFTPAQRYARLVQDQPEILQRVPLKHISSYLGITQVSLSRIRARQSGI
jgi:CRP-like cAMP-binding protein